ncbi:MAG: NAD kinase [Bacteroidetes bacterium]|nr:NAD kinase [Bacteroidota bacterium]MDA0879684.1 NAD kinase [Bacteroidota bacterium]MDA1115341.1 NAD kinase [Bacteroidota bacterium]
MKIALFGSRFNAEDVSVFNVLLDKLQAGQSQVYFESRFFEILQEFPDIKSVNPSQTWTQLDSSFDLLITIGGDGTLLRAIKYLNGLEVPVVGINTGRLGFLATIPKKFLEQSIDDLLAKRYFISERCVLEISSNHPISGLMDNEIALNEITVSRKDTTAMVKIETLLNGEYLTSYWADGLIVSTPTGSTGYSLSCGGPIVMPQSNNLVLTPIAPHNLNVRPLVIPDHLEVTLTVSSRTEQFLVSLDSTVVSVGTDIVLKIKKSAQYIKMVELKNEGFLPTLRKKLLWGEDKRN